MSLISLPGLLHAQTRLKSGDARFKPQPSTAVTGGGGDNFTVRSTGNSSTSSREVPGSNPSRVHLSSL